MDAKNQNLIVRLLSAGVLLPLILLFLYRGGAYTASLLGLSAAVCAVEYSLLVWKRLSLLAVLGALLAASWPWAYTLRPLAFETFAFWSLAAFAIGAWVHFLVWGPRENGPDGVAHAVMGVLYGGVGLTALTALRAAPAGFTWVMLTLTLTWLNDTCAYFAGRFLGRRKLLPEVSPNKTWEGFFGGMAGSVGGAFGVAFFFPGTLGAVDCLVTGLAAGVLGPLGDLCESMLKRAYGAKDSSRLVPGHGGMLDRIDALLFNAPMVYLYLRFVRDAISG